MTDWVETYFPTVPVSRRKRSLRRFLTACVFFAVTAGSLFVSFSGAPFNQTAFSAVQFAAGKFDNALDFNAIAPAAGTGKDADRIGREKSSRTKVEEKPDFIQPAGKSIIDNGEHQVQAVLVAKRIAVISSTIDGRLRQFPLASGDTFEKGALLAEYDCGVDYARLSEIKARQRLAKSQLDAYTKLKDMEVASNFELVQAKENHAQATAQISQVDNRLRLCKITAPFAGRVVNKTASESEFVQTGRVLMEIASRESLQAEFLIPSIWLRWLNIGTSLQVYISESDRYYNARVSRIHGEVDPVSQSVQVDAEIEDYSEVLLPGMSGRATFAPETVYKKPGFGFMGLVLQDNGGEQQQ